MFSREERSRVEFEIRNVEDSYPLKNSFALYLVIIIFPFPGPKSQLHFGQSCFVILSLLSCTFKAALEDAWASESQRSEEMTYFFHLLHGVPIIYFCKTITSWTCDLGRVWQGQHVSAPLEISSKTGGWSHLKQGFLTSALLTFWVEYSLLWGTVNYRMFSSILVLYPLDTSSIPSLVVTTKRCLQKLSNVPSQGRRGGGNIAQSWESTWRLDLSHLR